MNSVRRHRVDRPSGPVQTPGRRLHGNEPGPNEAEAPATPPTAALPEPAFAVASHALALRPRTTKSSTLERKPVVLTIMKPCADKPEAKNLTTTLMEWRPFAYRQWNRCYGWGCTAISASASVIAALLPYSLLVSLTVCLIYIVLFVVTCPFQSFYKMLQVGMHLPMYLKSLHQAVVGFFGLLELPELGSPAPGPQYLGHELAGHAPLAPDLRDHDPEPSARVVTCVAVIAWIFGWFTGHQGAR